jgi:hypothetical protein
VPEQILQGLQVRAGLVSEGRCAVSKVVQPDRGQPGAADEDPESGGGVVRVDRLAVRSGEHVAGGGPGFAVLGRLGMPILLVAMVNAQDLHAASVQSDGPTTGRGLGIALDDLVADRGPVPFDGEHAAVEVDVAPPQPTQLTSA